MKRILFLLSAAALILTVIYILPGCDELVTERITQIVPANPDAEFSVSPDSGCEPLTVTLNDQTTGPRDSVIWYLYRGDGNPPFDSIIVTNPPGDSSILNADTSYTFDSAGVYGVRITAVDSRTDADDSEYERRAVVVGTSVLDFGVSDTIVGRFDSVTFQPTVANYGAVNTWSWNFGDGQTSPDSVPRHAYTQAGQYTITLTATGPCGVKTIIDSNAVRVVDVPAITWIADTTEGCVPLQVSFQSTTELDTTQEVSIFTRRWDVGTGTNPGQNDSIRVNYDTPGSYDVSFELTLLYAFGLDTVSLVRADTIEDYITVYDNTSGSFDALTPTSACYNSTSQFQIMFAPTDAGSYDSLIWQFGDGTFFVDSSDAPSTVVHAYPTPGQYTVTLEAYGPCGNDTLVRENFVTLATPIQADSINWSTTAANDTVDVGQNIDFVDLTNGLVTSVGWDFSGGETATGPDVSHTYDTPGTYTVTLTVGNICNSLDTTFDITVLDTTGG